MDVSPTNLKILTHLARKSLVFPTPPLFDALRYQRHIYTAEK